MNDKPIQAQYRAQMNAIAEALSEAMPGVGFALLMFEFGKIEGGRVNYISNSRREDVRIALRELLARWDGANVPEIGQIKQ